MLMPLRVQWLVQPSVYTRRPCHIRSSHIACVYRPELENKQTSQWLDHSPCRCASPSPFAAVRREIEHQSLARQHSLAHGAPAVLPQSFSLGRQFLPRRRPIADTPASLRPAPCPMLPAPRIPAGSERITGLPKGHNMHRQIAECGVANRPGRIEPRVIKRRCQHYKLMQEPREVLKARLLAGKDLQ